MLAVLPLQAPTARAVYASRCRTNEFLLQSWRALVTSFAKFMVPANLRFEHFRASNLPLAHGVATQGGCDGGLTYCTEWFHLPVMVVWDCNTDP